MLQVEADPSGRKNSLTCAKVGRHVTMKNSYYYGRSFFSWSLFIGSDAPLWAQNLDFCLKWYEDSPWYVPNQGADGFPLGKKLCAKANALNPLELNQTAFRETEAYRDEMWNMNRPCYLRWGIVIN